MTPSDLAILYDEHATALTGFLRAITGSATESRDLLQEVFVRLASSGNTLESLREPRAILLTLARRAAIDMVRRDTTRLRVHQEASASAPLLAPITDPDAAMLRIALEESLAQLPDEQRAVVILQCPGLFAIHAWRLTQGCGHERECVEKRARPLCAQPKPG